MVIICLGVDEEHEGAANWASNSPNILNVAVTRAKNRVIIVGKIVGR
ncbi:helicase [Clostridium botulinum]